MAKLWLTLLGGFEVRSDSESSFTIPRKKAQMLLAYLAMHPRQRHLRDKLATLLWDDAPAEQARLSLRQALFAIRQALPFDPTLLEGDHVALAAEAVAVDAIEFEQLTRNDDPERLERAAALYQGDLLEGISPGSALFEEWLRTERERLHELALEAFAKLLAHQMKFDAAEPAIETAMRLLSLDPMQEVTHRALMRLYARQGRRAAALRQYQMCVDVLQHELGIEPEEATKQVYRELLPQPSPRLAVSQADSPPQRPRRRLRAPRRSRRLAAPLIGRNAEVERVSQALAEACAGHGQVVAILGEAGIGKTRLITALREATEHRGAQALIFQSHETERLLAFGPWVQAIREAGIVEGRLMENLRAGWIADLSYLFPELRQPEWPLPSEPIEARRLFDAMTELARSLAEWRPLVLVLEDLHWADEMSVRLFSFLGRRLEGRRILLVGTAREEELDGTSPVRRMLAELSQEERLVRLALAPLSQEHTRELVRSFAEGSKADESSLTRLEDRVWTLSGGNPFVIVESLREAFDTAPRTSPPDLPALPTKVRELILGRFARLSDASQHLLATAAVIGREFEFPVLPIAAGLGVRDAAEGVEELVRRRVLHAIGEQLDFTHELVREVARDRLLALHRKFLHGQIAKALEEVYAANLEPHYAVLGLHCSAGEIWEKAATYLRRAGIQAAARSAYREAVTWLEQALATLAHLPESRETIAQAVDLRLELQTPLAALGQPEKVLDYLGAAEGLAAVLHDRSRLARILALKCSTSRLTCEYERAIEAGERALTIATDLGDLELQVIAHYSLGVVFGERGDAVRARNEMRWIVDMLDPEVTNRTDPRSQHQLILACAWLARILSWLGQFVEGIAFGEQAIRIAESGDHPADRRILAGTFLGILYVAKGDLDRAIPLLERCLTLAQTFDIVSWIASTKGVLGVAYAQSGRHDEALQVLREASEVGKHVYSVGPNQLATVYLLADRPVEAAESARHGLDLSGQRKTRRDEAGSLWLLGLAASHRDRFRPGEAQKHLRQALALSTELGMRPLAAHCHLGLGKLYARTGKRERAQEHLTSATTMYREMGMTYWLGQVEAQMREPM